MEGIGRVIGRRFGDPPSQTKYERARKQPYRKRPPSPRPADYENGVRGFLRQREAARGFAVSAVSASEFLMEYGPTEPVSGMRVVVVAGPPHPGPLLHLLEEIQLARETHGADFGVYVVSPDLEDCEFWATSSAVVVAWQPDQPLADLCLEAALDMAAALCLGMRAEAREGARKERIRLVNAITAVEQVVLVASRLLVELGPAKVAKTQQRRTEATKGSLEVCISDMKQAQGKLEEALRHEGEMGSQQPDEDERSRRRRGAEGDDGGIEGNSRGTVG